MRRVNAPALVPEVVVEADDSSGCVKRIVPFSRSTTCAASAGSSASAATPARSSSDSDGVPSADCEPERLACRRGEAGQPRADQPVERLRDRQRLERVDVAVERAGELEREERVPTRALVDPEKRLACKRSAEPVAQQPMDGADAERPDRERRRRRRRAPTPAPTASLPSASRRASRTRTLALVEPRSAKARALAEEGSSHWTSSIATASGSRSLEQLQRAAHGDSERAADRPDRPRRSSTSSATSSARRRGGARAGSTSSRTPSNRSPSPACASPRSASAGSRREDAEIAFAALPRRPRARASTSRCPARLRARARRALLPPAR